MVTAVALMMVVDFFADRRFARSCSLLEKCRIDFVFWDMG